MAKAKVNLTRPERGELQQRTRELGEEVFNLRFQVSMAMAKNPARIWSRRGGRSPGSGPSSGSASSGAGRER